MTSAKSHTQPRKRRANFRLYKVGNAHHALQDFDKHRETVCYTFGQFSLVDVIAALLDRTGPARVDICVWAVGAADLQRTKRITAGGRATRLRWVLDQGFESRTPHYLEQMRQLYGDEQIRTIRAHAKFVLIANDEWQIVVRTSMNLNQNTRFEHLDVVDDPDLHRWHEQIVDGIFEREKAGDYSSKGMTDITGVPETNPATPVELGIAQTGTAATGKFGT